MNGNPAPIAVTVSLGQRLHRVRVIMDQLETPDKDIALTVTIYPASRPLGEYENLNQKPCFLPRHPNSDT
jgi:hypothetical protein